MDRTNYVTDQWIKIMSKELRAARHGMPYMTASTIAQHLNNKGYTLDDKANGNPVKAINVRQWLHVVGLLGVQGKGYPMTPETAKRHGKPACLPAALIVLARAGEATTTATRMDRNGWDKIEGKGAYSASECRCCFKSVPAAKQSAHCETASHKRRAAYLKGKAAFMTLIGAANEAGRHFMKI